MLKNPHLGTRLFTMGHFDELGVSQVHPNVGTGSPQASSMIDVCLRNSKLTKRC